jgi:hypothetical protein
MVFDAQPNHSIKVMASGRGQHENVVQKPGFTENDLAEIDAEEGHLEEALHEAQHALSVREAAARADAGDKRARLGIGSVCQTIGSVANSKSRTWSAIRFRPLLQSDAEQSMDELTLAHCTAILRCGSCPWKSELSGRATGRAFKPAVNQSAASSNQKNEWLGKRDSNSRPFG